MKNHPEKTKINFLLGSWFVFKIDGHTISLHGSPFSGKETVYFDDEVVSKKRNMTTESSHHFTNMGDEYEVRLNIPKLFSGIVECSVNKNGVLVRKQATSRKKRNSPLRILLVLSFGLLYGFIHSLYNWSLWMFVIFILIFVAVVPLFSGPSLEVIEENS